MVVNETFDLVRFFEIYRLAQLAFEIVVMIITINAFTYKANSIAKDFSKITTKIGLTIALIFFVASSYFPETEHLTAKYNTEKERVEQFMLINPTQTNEPIGDYEFVNQSEIQKENRAIIRTIYADTISNDPNKYITVHITRQFVPKSYDELKKKPKNSEIYNTEISITNYLYKKDEVFKVSMKTEDLVKIVKAMSNQQDVFIQPSTENKETYQFYISNNQ